MTSNLCRRIQRVRCSVSHGIPARAADAPEHVRRLDQLDAVQLALDDTPPLGRVDGHQRDVVPAAGERYPEVQATVVRPALAGGVVDDEQDLQWIRHEVGADSGVGWLLFPVRTLTVPTTAKRDGGHNRRGAAPVMATWTVHRQARS